MATGHRQRGLGWTYTATCVQTLATDVDPSTCCYLLPLGVDPITTRPGTSLFHDADVGEGGRRTGDRLGGDPTSDRPERPRPDPVIETLRVHLINVDFTNPLTS